jgi:hypothetical protein
MPQLDVEQVPGAGKWKHQPLVVSSSITSWPTRTAWEAAGHRNDR